MTGPEAHARRLREAVLAAIPSLRGDDPELDRFRELMASYPRRGGKGLRGRLTLLSAVAHGASVDDAMPAAVALELFQNWVLIHDDIEDDSETRRGEPALHRTVGTPVAVNVGDALHVTMWRVLVEARGPWREAVLAEMLDVIARTAEGQHLDLAWTEAGRFDVSEDEYLRMVERKTGYYTVVGPLRLGAHVAGVAPDPRILPAGLALGRAFQIRDDVLNLVPQEDGAYGKEFVGDLYEGKRTLVLARAFATLPPGGRARLRTLLGRPRDEKRHDEMLEALTLVRSTDAIAYAQAAAEEAAREGLTTLREVLRELPGRGAAAEVLTLAESLAHRDR